MKTLAVGLALAVALVGAVAPTAAADPEPDPDDCYVTWHEMPYPLNPEKSIKYPLVECLY